MTCWESLHACSPRPLRFIPEHSVVEITTRTLQGKLLLNPSPELANILLGIIGKAQAHFGMTIHALVFLSTRGRLLSSRSSPGQLALFIQFVNANIAKEAGRLRVWRERLGRAAIAPSSSLTRKPRALASATLWLRQRAREIREIFPFWAVPPQLPFKESA